LVSLTSLERGSLRRKRVAAVRPHKTEVIQGLLGGFFLCESGRCVQIPGLLVRVGFGSQWLTRKHLVNALQVFLETRCLVRVDDGGFNQTARAARRELAGVLEEA